MLKLLKYIRGSLRIRVSGFSPERFMNLCSNRGILLWDIVREGDVYYMSIGLKGFWKLRPIARKSGTRVAVLEKCGLPFFLPKLLKRKVFVGGLICVLAFWIWSSFYIWDIDLEGNYQITDDVFYKYLKETKVTVGMRKDSLDIKQLEKEIRRRFEQVTWVSVKLSGTRLRIDIKENDAPILVDVPEETAGRDMVSEYSGTVVSMIVRSGVPKVAIGDVVEEGTLLVEGRVPIYNDDTTLREYFYVDADADIVLEHTRSFSERLPFDYIKKVYTGRTKTHYYLRLGENEWDIAEKRPFLVYDSIIRESRPLVLEKLSVPVFFGSYTHREYQNIECEYTLKEARELLEEKIFAFLSSLEEKGVQILEKDVKIDTDSSSWLIEGSFLVRESVGVKRETVRDDREPEPPK